MDITNQIISFLIAVAAACRSRQFGNQFTGSVALGIFCGLIGAVFRDFLLLGRAEALLLMEKLPLSVLLGGIVGAYFGRFGIGERIFFFADCLGTGSITSFSTVIALRANDCGIVAAVTLGAVIGLLHAFIRDVALGDAATFVSERWHVAQLALSSIVAAGVALCWVMFVKNNWLLPFDWRVMSIALGTVTFVSMKICINTSSSDISLSVR